MIIKNDAKLTIRQVLLGLCALPLVAEAGNQIAMSEREHVQRIVWIMEATTFVTIVAIFFLLWRFIKRDQAKRKARQKPRSKTSEN